MKTHSQPDLITSSRFPFRNRMLTLLLISVILLPGMGKAQKMEGTIRYLVTFNWTKQMAAVDYLSKQQRDKVTYMWGSRAEWKVYTSMWFTPNQTKYEDSEERAEKDDEGYSWRKDVYSIRRDFSTGKAIDMIQMLGKVYVVEDSIRPQNWKILNDIKEVAGHICMDAFWTDTLKQQKVLAWFAMDMPVSGGPERFCGLPGMILEVDVNDGGMLITADKIEMKALTTEMDFPKKIKGKRIHEADYTTILKKYMAERRAAEEPPFWGIRY